jgi:uncharacterized membrane protein
MAGEEQVKRWAWVPLGLACVALCVPLLIERGHSELGFALQRGFALVCHQQPERSFIVFGGSAAVCARCLGIYLGAAAGLLIRVFRRAAWQWLIVTVAINLVDWFAELAGVHGNWMGVRFVLGIALGMVGAMIVVQSLSANATNSLREIA